MSQWADPDPIATTRVIESEAREAVTQMASVDRSGQMVKQPARLNEMMDVAVLAAEI